MQAHMKTASPIGIGARFCLLPRIIDSPSVVTAPPLTADSSTTKQSSAVPMISATRALTIVTSVDCRPLEPRPPVRSVLDVVASDKRAAPAMDPKSCATTYVIARTGWQVPTMVSARVTAQLMCPPLV